MRQSIFTIALGLVSVGLVSAAPLAESQGCFGHGHPVCPDVTERTPEPQGLIGHQICPGPFCHAEVTERTPVADPSGPFHGFEGTQICQGPAGACRDIVERAPEPQGFIGTEICTGPAGACPRDIVERAPEPQGFIGTEICTGPAGACPRDFDERAPVPEPSGPIHGFEGTQICQGPAGACRDVIERTPVAEPTGPYHGFEGTQICPGPFCHAEVTERTPEAQFHGFEGTQICQGAAGACNIVERAPITGLKRDIMFRNYPSYCNCDEDSCHSSPACCANGSCPSEPSLHSNAAASTSPSLLGLGGLIAGALFLV